MDGSASANMLLILPNDMSLVSYKRINYGYTHSTGLDVFINGLQYTDFI